MLLRYVEDSQIITVSEGTTSELVKFVQAAHLDLATIMGAIQQNCAKINGKGRFTNEDLPISAYTVVSAESINTTPTKEASKQGVCPSLIDVNIIKFNQ